MSGWPLQVLDLVGIFVFGITGALVGVRKQLDVFGIQVLALVTGLGGGFIRDVLIGATPPAALVDWRYLVVPVVAGLITFFLHPRIGRVERLVNIFDAAGLALFCVTGATKALAYGLPPLSAALVGTISGIGGGVIRDLLSNRVPVVLRSEIYATPAFLGAGIVVVVDALNYHAPWTTLAAATVCFVIRIFAIRRGWNAPLPRMS
ncbi:trimeric intracellular cation channel family protein [Kribbella sp. CA-293567]|uniref:trimeric intracellular cation channel family protein n=1 Tax=Kribbella sp. CA-293567 TaxID=3002436 RepID=UPI0022DE68D9|nr:trimeric intracellular cation channel family protein [Kribbella sp. CA-293567]WBQ02268.1 trimeric intracellular cation channel family protein [Kribbella sp. CA-293567]